MSVRSAPAEPIDLSAHAMDPSVLAADAADLGEGATGFQATSRNHPLNRRVTVAIRASLAELTTNNGKAQWSPSSDQLRAIYQQRQFVDLGGEAQKQGDLKSVVLHSMTAKNINSSFPIALGARITGVEEQCFSSIGSAYSMIALPNHKSSRPTTLQEEDVSVAYDFAKRYPGYTAENLESNGIHAVPQRRFVLVAASHPLVTAIQENAASLQTADITQMPEQLIKISSNLYDTLMPLVKEQVSSQLKVCDLSRMSVEIHPADFGSWSAAADQLSREAVAPLKGEQRRAIKKCDGDPDRISQVNAEFADRIEAEQTAVANTPLEFFVEISTVYNFL